MPTIPELCSLDYPPGIETENLLVTRWFEQIFKDF